MTAGRRVLLVKDLATDGASKFSFVNAIRETGASCVHAATIFYYGIFPKAEHGVPLHHLCTWRHSRTRSRRRKIRSQHAGRDRRIPRRAERIAAGAKRRMRDRWSPHLASRGPRRRRPRFGCAGTAAATSIGSRRPSQAIEPIHPETERTDSRRKKRSCNARILIIHCRKPASEGWIALQLFRSSHRPGGGWSLLDQEAR